MEAIMWVLIVTLFVVGMLGAIFPILPGALAIYGAFFVYGFFAGFDPFGFWFWSMQTALVAVIFIADYAVNALGVKKFGGSRASVIGSTLGLIAGIFFPFGLLIGPFAGAVLAELLRGTAWNQALRVGFGAVVGFFSGVAAKFVLQTMMIIIFVVWIIVQ